MNKLIVSLVLAASLISTGVVSAQTYANGCVSIPAGLSSGSRGSDVTNLQNFLVAQNYPGGGSWMVTGYFGAATASAVRNFQQMQGLSQTGAVDAATASAISRVSCGGAVAVATPTYPYTYQNIPTTYPSSYSYPSYLSYYPGSPAITSLSQNTGGAGTAITVYGVGFDQSNNTVNFGNTPVYNVASQNGTSLTFSVPTNYYSYSFAGTPVQMSVQNARGTSNAVSFTVVGTPYGCGSYLSIPCGGCSYPYNYGSNCSPNNPSSLSIDYLNPSSGGVGTTVTVYGSGFSTSGNSVRFGPGIIANLPSFDGHALTFTVPSSLAGYGTQPITLSTYQVSVANAYGVISNAVPFTVTSLGSSYGAPSIASVTGPTSLSVGQQGVWTVLVNTMNNQYLTLSVNWGDQNVYGASASASQQIYGSGQQTNTLTHAYYTSGTYTILFTVTNSAGQQATYTSTIVVGGNSGYGVPSISVLAPSYGSVGTQIAIVGSGFNLNDNTVRFGIGGKQHVQSQNGTILYFTIPSYLSPCDTLPQGSACALYAQQVVPGQYQVSVGNGNGVSNALTFTVQ